jgi:molecular chaperone GrpE
LSKEKKREVELEEQAEEVLNEESSEHAEPGILEKAPEIPPIEAELTDTKDKLLRLAAEFDNYKKRSERERLSLSAFVQAQTVKALLVPYDNLERALASEATGEDFTKGVELSLRQLKDAFAKLGLSGFGERGDGFDPELHEAVMHTEDEELGENTVSKVLQKGYKLGETVLRHAMVEVAN